MVTNSMRIEWISAYVLLKFMLFSAVISLISILIKPKDHSDAAMTRYGEVDPGRSDRAVP